MDWIIDILAAWWQGVVLTIYTIMIIIRSCKVVSESVLTRQLIQTYPEKYGQMKEHDWYNKTRLQFLGYGIREEFFDTKEEYFRLWDIVVFAFYLPALAMAFVYLLMKAGALEFMPFLRRVFGFKLFRIRKPEVKKDVEVSGSNS
ncbi:hypothetical protein D3C85_806020 [compost metagenome]